MGFSADIFAGRKVAVFGLGRSGLACARALAAGGAEVLCWDDGEAGRRRAGEMGLAVRDLREEDFPRLAALVLAPGVPLTHPEPHWTVARAKEAGVEVMGDTEVFFRQVSKTPGVKIIAITGTNGKSTTTALIGHVLRSSSLDAHVGGNIGTAVFDLAEPKWGRIYVIEMSSYQIDLSPTFRPDVGVLLNLSPDHLERHGTMENYAAVKGRLFANMGEGDTAVISVDDEWCRAALESVPEKVSRCPISVRGLVDEGICAPGGVLQERAAGKTLRGVDLSMMKTLRGEHNWQNACAAWAACRAMSMDGMLIGRGFMSFPGLAHRMQIAGQEGRVMFVNDSKATNAAAAARALDSFDDIHWIAGGLAKEGGIGELMKYAAKIRRAYLIGEAAEEFAAVLERAGIEYEMCGTLDVAVREAAEKAAGDAAAARPVVLLAPACASFDQYNSFEERGEHFLSLVEELTARADAGGEEGEERP